MLFARSEWVRENKRKRATQRGKKKKKNHHFAIPRPFFCIFLAEKIFSFLTFFFIYFFMKVSKAIFGWRRIRRRKPDFYTLSCAVSSFFSFSLPPRPLFFSFLCFFFLSSSSSFEWLLKWDFLNREEKNMRGESFAVCWVVIYTLLCSLCIFYFIFFFWCVIREENCNLNFFFSCRSLLCLLFCEKKIYWTKNVCCDIVSCTVGLMLWS